MKWCIPNPIAKFYYSDGISDGILLTATFSEIYDSSSHTGYMIFLVDKYDNINLIYYWSIKYRRAVRSVLGSKTFALADGCDTVIIIQHDLKHILGISMKFKILTDSATLFNVMIINAPTIEKRIIIENNFARQEKNIMRK